MKVTDEFSIETRRPRRAPALVLIDAVARLCRASLARESVAVESFSGGLLDHPQLRPAGGVASSSGAAFRASRGDRSMAEAAADRPHARGVRLDTGEENEGD
jgi:hypothetical protein